MATDTTERIEAAPAAGSDLGTIVVVSAAHLVSHLHIMTLPVLLPLLKEELQVGFFELGLALTTFNVVSGLTQAPMGFLVDRIGARTVLVAGLLLGGLAFVSLGLNTSYAWLIVVALVAGLANCVYHPADYAILTDGIAEDRIGRAFSFHTFAGFVGGAIAPPLLLGLAALSGLGSSLIVAGLFAWAIAAIVFVVPIAQGADRGRSRAAAGGASQTAGILTPAVLGLTLFFTLLALAHGAMYSFSIVALIAAHGISLAAATAALTAYLAGSARRRPDGRRDGRQDAAARRHRRPRLRSIGGHHPCRGPAGASRGGHHSRAGGRRRAGRHRAAFARHAGAQGRAAGRGRARVRHRLDRVQHRRHLRAPAVRLADGQRGAALGFRRRRHFHGRHRPFCLLRGPQAQAAPCRRLTPRGRLTQS